MRDVGIARARQCALIETLDGVIGDDRVAVEVRRRAQWLKWGIEGREPGTEPLEFIDDFSARSHPPPPANPDARARWVESPDLVPA